MNGKNLEVEQIRYPGQVNLEMPTSKPFILNEALGEYLVLRGGVPLDIYQRAELATVEEERLRIFHSAIQERIAPVHQALHTTAFLQNKFYQEQDALMQGVLPKRTGIITRLSQKLRSPFNKKVAPKTVARGSHWDETINDKYYSNQLFFCEDISTDPIGIRLERYDLELSESKYDRAFASLKILFDHEGRLSQISVSSNDCQTEDLMRLIKDQDFKAKELVYNLTRPKIQSSGFSTEYSPRTHTEFEFQLQEKPTLIIRQKSGKYNEDSRCCQFQCDSTFKYDSAANVLNRHWYSHDRTTAKVHGMSLQEEMKPIEFLALLKGLLIIPMEKI
jgi:hypothetical protein